MTEPGEATAGADIDKYIDEAVAAGKGWSEEDRKAYLASIDDETHPFFADVEKVDPVMVEAFRQLTYEGETHESLADHFRTEGNERFRRTRLNPMYYGHAALLYTEAVKHAVLAEQTPDMVRLRATLLANRAAANLGAKNFGSVKRDCDESLRLVPGNVKCYYRKARALEALKQYQEALDCCDAGLKLDAESRELCQLREKCSAGAAGATARAAAGAAALQAECDRAARIYRAARSRGVSLAPSAFDSSHRHYASDMAPEIDEQGGTAAQRADSETDVTDVTDETAAVVRWPLLLLYPAVGHSDAVHGAGEDDAVGEHVAVVLPEEGAPPPWDDRNEYRCSRVEIYARAGAARAYGDEAECVEDFKAAEKARAEVERRQRETPDPAGGSWLHVHPACSVLQVLRAPGVVAQGGALSLYVYPRESEAHERFLRHNGARVKELAP